MYLGKLEEILRRAIQFILGRSIERHGNGLDWRPKSPKSDIFHGDQGEYLCDGFGLQGESNLHGVGGRLGAC